MKQTQAQSDLPKVLQVTTLLLALNELRIKGHTESGFTGKQGHRSRAKSGKHPLCTSSLPADISPHTLTLPFQIKVNYKISMVTTKNLRQLPSLYTRLTKQSINQSSLHI